MKRIIDIDNDYYELIKYIVIHGQKFKPFEIIVNSIPYDEKPKIRKSCMNCLNKGIAMKDYPCKDCIDCSNWREPYHD